MYNLKDCFPGKYFHPEAAFYFSTQMKKEFLIKILFFSVCILLVTPMFAQHPGRSSDENRIIIAGESNIQDFVVRYYFKKSIRTINIESPDSTSLQKGIIQIPVNNLLFSNRHMKDDFLNLVHAKKYPEIKLIFNPRMLSGLDTTKHKTVPIIIEITNTKKTYQVPVTCLNTEGVYIKLGGQVQIKLSDFKLKPKRYLFGLIRLKDKLDINFILYFYRKLPDNPKIKCKLTHYSDTVYVL